MIGYDPFFLSVLTSVNIVIPLSPEAASHARSLMIFQNLRLSLRTIPIDPRIRQNNPTQRAQVNSNWILQLKLVKNQDK